MDRFKQAAGYATYLLVAAGFFGIYFLVSSITHTDAATNTSPWLSGPMPTLTKVSDLATGTTKPYSISGNRDCQDEKIVTLPRKIMPFWPFLQNEQSHTACVVNTYDLAVSTTGYVKRAGTRVWGSLKDQIGRSAIIIPVPASKTAIYIDNSAGTGVYLYFAKDFASTLKTDVSAIGEVTYKMTQPYTAGLRDKAGNLLMAQTDSLAFSSNGKWMVVDSPYVGHMRVNLETFEALPFDTPYNYRIGLTPTAQTAITNDGRYAVVASKEFDQFRLYDLATCAAVPQHLTGPVECKSYDLQSFMRDRVLDYFSVSTLRFITNNAFKFYVTSKANSIVKTSLYTLTAPGEANSRFEYLALGDSFASGEGAYDYRIGTDTKDNKCHTSQRSYPYLIASELELNTSASVACSGAVIDDITSLEKVSNNPQAKDGKKDISYDESIFEHFSPGYRAQYKFIDNYQPNAVTISAVGNDIGFKDKIVRCLEPDTCYPTYEDRLEIVRQINGQFTRLTDMIRQLKAADDPSAKFYIIGYPDIADPAGKCDANIHLNREELLFSQQLVHHLNTVIKAAADNAGAFYVDVENALVGHRFCETNSSQIAINGLTLGNDIVNLPFVHGPIGNESYHPNWLGHELLKNAILEKTNYLARVMPYPDPEATPPAESSSLPILDAPHSGRQIYYVNYDQDLGNDIAFRGGIWRGVLDSMTSGFNADTRYHVTMHSDPVDLGTYTSDENGNLDFQVQIPSSVPPGFHVIHVYGNNLAGEPIDYYKTIYVAASESDYDGDGIPNNIDPCIIVEPSGQDVDKDGIDDACDGYIGDPPLEVGPTPVPLPIIVPADPPEDIQKPLIPFGENNPNPDATIPQIQQTQDNPTVQPAPSAAVAVAVSQNVQTGSNPVNPTTNTNIGYVSAPTATLPTEHVAGVNIEQASMSDPTTSKHQWSAWLWLAPGTALALFIGLLLRRLRQIRQA